MTSPSRQSAPVRCPVCGREVKRNTRGALFEHIVPREPGSPVPLGCPGSNHTIPAARRINEEIA